MPQHQRVVLSEPITAATSGSVRCGSVLHARLNRGVSVVPSARDAVYLNDVSPTNGPGAWIGTQLDPVNAPQIRKIVATEIIEAARFGRTALSSPNVTVLSEVKSCRTTRAVTALTAK